MIYLHQLSLIGIKYKFRGTREPHIFRTLHNHKETLSQNGCIGRLDSVGDGVNNKSEETLRRFLPPKMAEMSSSDPFKTTNIKGDITYWQQRTIAAEAKLLAHDKCDEKHSFWKQRALMAEAKLQSIQEVLASLSTRINTNH